MSRPANELLYDSEAALRLVDTALNELHGANAPARAPAPAAPAAPVPAASPLSVLAANGGLVGLQEMLIHASIEIATVLTRLRECRHTLERASVEKLAHGRSTLAEVSSATEVATIDIINAVEKSLALVDDMDAAGDEAANAALRAQLRDELSGVKRSLQFQGITTQQLNYVSSVLVEMESRVAQMASAFDPRLIGQATVVEAVTVPAEPQPHAFDPAAATTDAGSRQALVDELFGRR